MSTRFEDQLRARSGWRGELPTPTPAEPAYCCQAAREFAVWVEQLVAGLTEESKQPTLVQLHQATLLLVERLRLLRSATTRPHHDRIGTTRGPCLVGVFLAGVDELYAVQLRFHRPELPIPREAPRPVPQVLPLQAMGLLLGEE